MIIYITILIIILFIITCLLHNTEKYQNVGSGFTTNDPKSCNNLGMGDCLKMQNCGFAITNNSEKCLSGDVYGPYDKQITKESGYKWYHNDPYTRALIANDNNYRNTDINVFDSMTN